jgi:hypothetical protein
MIIIVKKNNIIIFNSDVLVNNDLVVTQIRKKMKELGRELYNIFDYQHLIKNLRNLLFNEGLNAADGSYYH